MTKTERDERINQIIRNKYPVQGLRTHENMVAHYGVARPGKTLRKRLKQQS